MKDFYLGWDAFPYFEKLTESNNLCREHGFRTVRVSSLQGLEDVLAAFQNGMAFVAVANESDGSISLNNTAYAHFVKTIFLALRYPIDDMAAREDAFKILTEIFRQFLSRLNRERTRIANGFIYIDNNLTFNEIPEAFANGCACAFFNIKIGKACDLVYRADEWQD